MAKTPLLTIGMANHQDYTGVWFTIQAIRLYHPEVADEIEFVVLDNAPKSPHGEAIRNYISGNLREKGHYLPVSSRQSTSLRNLIVHAANTEYVMVLDSHVFLAPGSLQKLIKFLHQAQGCPDLFQGPIISESGSIVGTHMNPAFRGENFGTWGTMPECEQLEEPYEIPGHGMGLWVCRRDNWPGYHHAYRAFGGEELIIHEKYRLAGMYCWSLPFLKWQHRFGHVGGASYNNTLAEKYRNFLIGFHEVGLPLDFVHRYYGARLKPEQRQSIVDEVKKIFPSGPAKVPAGYKPFLGYPIRINDYCASDDQNYRPFEKPIFANTEDQLPDAHVQQAAA